MSKHIGRDRNTRAKFQVTRYDLTTGFIELHQGKDGWDPNSSEYLTLPWAEFIQNLIDGQYEINSLNGHTLK
jgi:hypothetical protein